MRDAASSYYFGSGTRRHEVSHLTDNWATMWCGIGGRTSGPAVKVRSSRVEPNCRACARAKARNLAYDAQEREQMLTDLQTCLQLLGEDGYLDDPDFPEVAEVLDRYEKAVGVDV